VTALPTLERAVFEAFGARADIRRQHSHLALGTPRATDWQKFWIWLCCCSHRGTLDQFRNLKNLPQLLNLVSRVPDQ
jgi:hypothetical protein